jgi:glycosyltransferase involved in cell wall biosynthesis
MAREIARMGHQVTVAALHADFSSLTETRFVKDGVNIQYVAQMHVLKKGSQKTYFSNKTLVSLAASAAWKLSEVARKSQADIIHVGKPHPMNGIAGLINKYLRGKPFILDCDDYEAASGRFNNRWQKSGIAYFEKWLPRHSNAVTVNTHFMIEKMTSWGIPPQKLHHIPNGVDFDRFKKPAEAEVDSLAQRLGLQGKLVVSFIGSMGLTTHSIDLLLQAFIKVNQQIPDSRLLLVGGGEDYNQLKTLTHELGIAEVTRFCGRVHPSEIPLYYHLSQVSVDPVRDNDAARGRSPLKLFESWACGVPFVTGDVGDRRRILGTPSAGLLALPGDPDSLSICIVELLRNQNLSNQIRNIGYERALEYSWEKITKKLEGTYHNIHIKVQ